MLPNTPLHWLLFHAHRRPPGASPLRALVMTSGNVADEPIVKDAEAAHRVLAPFADGFLDHDREIFMRVDDSVVRRFAGRTLFVRRARGYVPAAIPLPGSGPPVLGCGAEVKNTFTLTTPGAAVVSQHIGDLENHETLEFFLETLENLKSVYRVAPVAIAHDLHPGYFSTRWALEQEGVERWGVQHHWAHIASVLAETGLAGPVIGVALDGSGYGPDGTIWGGEFLIADGRSFERAASFLPVPLPGGEGAIRHPWRMALSYLAAAGGGVLPDRAAVRALVARAGEADAATVLKIRENRALSPLTSGAGRLFEAAAALAGLCDHNTLRGRGGDAARGGGRRPASASPTRSRSPRATPPRIDFSPAFLALLDDLERGAGAGLRRGAIPRDGRRRGRRAGRAPAPRDGPAGRRAQRRRLPEPAAARGGHARRRGARAARAHEHPGAGQRRRHQPRPGVPAARTFADGSRDGGRGGARGGLRRRNEARPMAVRSDRTPQPERCAPR